MPGSIYEEVPVEGLTIEDLPDAQKEVYDVMERD
jgi:hypothetical protein